MLCVAIYSVDSDNFDTLQRESQIVIFDFIGICSIHRSSAEGFYTLFRRGISTNLFLFTDD